MRILITGYGNPLRSDDAVGSYVVQKLSGRNSENVTCEVRHQLHLELLETASSYDIWILVDCQVGNQPVDFRLVEPANTSSRQFSHHLDPEILATLAKDLYGVDLKIYLCSIRGEYLGLGETLSPAVQERAESAIQKIEAFLEETCCHA